MCRAQGEQWPYASTKYALANTKDEVLVKPKICPQIQKISLKFSPINLV